MLSQVVLHGVERNTSLANFVVAMDLYVINGQVIGGNFLRDGKHSTHRRGDGTYDQDGDYRSNHDSENCQAQYEGLGARFGCVLLVDDLLLVFFLVVNKGICGPRELTGNRRCLSLQDLERFFCLIFSL